MSANSAATPAPTIWKRSAWRAPSTPVLIIHGVLLVMRYLRMLPPLCTRPRRIEPLEGRSSGWVRAPQSGILRTLTLLGARVEAHQCLGVVADPFGEREAEVHTPTAGIVIGRINLPLVSEGEALFHIARVEPGAESGAETLTTLIPDLEEARATETPAEPPLGRRRQVDLPRVK